MITTIKNLFTAIQNNTGLLAAIKSKFLSFICVVLITALSISYIAGRNDRVELTALRAKVIEHVALNEKLSAQNVGLLKEIKDRPPQYITVTKEVGKEVCNGAVTQAQIDALPSKKEMVDDEKNTADIDARLPTDLIKLLNKAR